MKGESRYVLHPATLDASLQLSILAGHQNTATKFKRAFMPTSFESIKVWPGIAEQASGSVDSYAHATLKGVRGLSADVVLLDGSGRRMLEATNIFLTASDQSAPSRIDESRPYTRMVWKPDFDSLTTHAMEQMFPPIVLSDDAVIPSLNDLALHQLIHFKATHADVFATGSEQHHLQRLLDWTTEKLATAALDSNSQASKVLGYSDEYRSEEIERLSGLLMPRSSEARLMCHLYKNLDAIYKGEKTGIQVALQDNLLLDNYETGQVYREGNRRLASTVALHAHKNPKIRILEVGAGTGSATNEVLPALQGNSPWRQYSEYRFTDTTPSFLASGEERFSQYGGMTFGTFDMERSGESQGYQQDWDVVVASNVIHATSDIRSTLINIRNVLKPGGKMILLELTQSQLSAGLVLGTFSDFWKADHDPNYPRYDGPFLSKSLWQTVLPASGFSGLDFYLDDYADGNVSATVISATAVDFSTTIQYPIATYDKKAITVVYGASQDPHPSVQALSDHLAKTSGVPVDVVPLTEVEPDRHRRFIFLLEMGSPFFLDVTPQEWSIFQSALSRSTSCLWVTTGDLMVGSEPLYAMISGLARGMKTENNSLRISVLDIDRVPGPSDTNVFDVIGQLEARVANKGNLNDDSEFRFKDGILHISRLATDEALCEQSKIVSKNPDEPFKRVPLQSLKSTPLQLAIDKPGVLSTVYFKPDPEFSKSIAADEVEIETRYAGVNNKDIAVLTGRHHSDSFSDECSGVITQVGSDVKNLKVGDMVYCQSFSKFGNFVRDKAAFCQKLEGDDTLEGTATLPIAFSTAIYGLVDLGRLEKGETVLIQSATGAVGLAACQIARMIGAEIYATVGTEEKKRELLAMDFGIQPDHIFPSRDRFTAKKLLEQTNSKGFDVILCSSRGELMHEYWKCIATCGRFVEIGRTEVLDSGSLRLDVFRRNATFTSFDLEVMSKNKPQVTARYIYRFIFPCHRSANEVFFLG